ncbi:MAG: isochorismatase family protein [Armatimonadetes bacterium]|nr:MAG: isochorismatase family protein [Armatimonadota bacterium]
MNATDRASRVLESAQRWARLAGARRVGPEHLFAALMEESDSVAVEALRAAGADPARLRRDAARIALPGGQEPLPPSETLEEALRTAEREAKRLGHPAVGTEHLLLALAACGDSMPTRILLKLGLTPDVLRRAVQDLLHAAAGISAPRSRRLADANRSALLVVDIQDSFLAPIPNRDAVVHRSSFLIEIANLLSVPILVTEQYRERMGATTEAIRKLLPEGTPCVDKLCFSSVEREGIWAELRASRRNQVVLVGIETHICVTQSALDLLDSGREVFLCADAAGARPDGAHEIALGRLARAGVQVTHTESVAYEWLKEAGTDPFRDALKIVKRYSN